MLREDAVPSVFPFITKKVTTRRQLVRIGLEESDVEQCDGEDNKRDDSEATNKAGPSSGTMEESEA